MVSAVAKSEVQDSSLRRRGRPRIQDAADEIVASVLATAGPRVSSRDYSTRRIALMTGLSQTAVSRAVASIRREGRAGAVGETGGVASDQALRIVEFTVQFPHITLVFAPVRSGGEPRRHDSSRRVAAVMAALHVSGAADWLGRSDSVAHDNDPHRIVWEPEGQTWDEFLDRVAGALACCAQDPDAIPADLLSRLANRAGQGLHGVRWLRSDSKTSEDFDSNSFTLSEYPAPSQGRPRTSPWLPHHGLSITEQIAIALRKEIMDSAARPGDRIPPSTLASRMGIPVSTVRNAMRRMVDDGLLTFRSGSFAVPDISGRDIIDLYAARRQVGTVILRACGQQPRHRMLAPRIALQSLEAAARHGTAVDVDQADLHFQQELADSSGLIQSARSFHALTLRVRMFISVLQLDYRPAVDRIVSDDRRLLHTLVNGHAEEAVQVWWAKLDDAVRHMSAMAPSTFDRDLWRLLTGNS